jgi:hypothetical protein
LMGQRIVLVEFAANGSGKFRLVKILEDSSLTSDAPVTSTATPI